MKDMRGLLESEREVERAFVAGDVVNPKGWSVGLTMFHLLKWRERMHDALSAVREGRAHTPPPENIDEFNDTELAGGSRLPLAETAKSADVLLSSLIDLYEILGDGPFKWNRSSTTTEALLVNSYTHPRFHFVEYFKENGDLDGAVRLQERTVAELRQALAPPNQLGVQMYNLACLRCAEGRLDDALSLIEESSPMWPNLKNIAGDDPDLAPLKGEPRFVAIVGR
jgi:hypothetical protein